MQKDQIFWFILQVLYYWIPRKKTKLEDPEPFENSGSLYMKKVGTNVIGLWRWCLNHLLCSLSMCFLAMQNIQHTKTNFLHCFLRYLQVTFPLTGKTESFFFLQSCSIYHTARLEKRKQTCQIQKMRDRTKRNRALKERKRKGSESRNKRN